MSDGKATKRKRKSHFSDSSSTSLQLSSLGIENIIERLCNMKHRDSTHQNYYAVWLVFNKFLMKLDVKPSTWEKVLLLFVGYLMNNRKQSSTVCSYVSVICTVLQDDGIKMDEDWYLITSLTKACRLINDQVQVHLPIHKGMLNCLITQIKSDFTQEGQPF